VRAAAANQTPLAIRGGGSKDFYGGAGRGESLSVAAYRGIIDYEPSELVITARAGTPLAEIEAALRERGQMLAFEPPHFDQLPSPLTPPPARGRGERRDGYAENSDGNTRRLHCRGTCRAAPRICGSCHATQSSACA